MVTTGRRVLLAMSGGVDSSVAAILLKQRGFKVEGVYMQNWDELDETGHCPSEADYSSMQRVCQSLNIPHSKVNFVKEYWNNVFSDVLHSYQRGMTPNPDVLCNKHIKFKAFLEYAMGRGADIIATGHYAQLRCREEGLIQLCQAVDKNKDQTYFLSTLDQKQLQRVLFPVGDLMKADVKGIANMEGLHDVAVRKESMGLCFVGKRHFGSFISQYLPDNPGEVVSLEDGRTVGKHRGTHLYTVGQRARIAGVARAYFVVGKDVQKKRIIVAEGTEHPALYILSFRVASPQWVAGTPPFHAARQTLTCTMRYRHRQDLFQCDLTIVPESGSITVCSTAPMRAVAPGQYAVFYSGEQCLGGGVIDVCGPSLHELGLTSSDFSAKIT